MLCQQTGMVSRGVLWQARPFHVDLIYRAPHSRTIIVRVQELRAHNLSLRLIIINTD